MNKKTRELFPRPLIPNEQWEDDFNEKDDFMDYLHILKMQDLLKSESERVSPDTYACDCFFLENFITEDMSYEFPLIVNDFLRHEFTNLAEYEKDYYVNDFPNRSHPIEALQNKFLNLMYSAACHEKEYAIRLFRNLYKTYYKKEYNQLKRFRTISAAEVLSLADEPEYGVSIPGIARILSMSRIMGIKIDIDCSFLYLLLADKYVELELEKDADFCAAPFPEGLYEECLNQVNEWMENIKKGLCTAPEYEAYRKADSFIATVFSHNDYPSDYAVSCHSGYFNLRITFTRVLMILNTKYPKREINFEEVQLFAPLYYCCEALCNICDETNDFVNDFLGFENECFSEDMPVMFKPEDSWKSAPQKAPVPSKKPAAVSESHDVYETKNLLAEIESLRQKLHSQEQATRHSHSLYEQIKKEKDELTSSLHQYENEHQELIALRNHVYQSTEADIPVSPVSLEDMEQEIEQKHIVIIGGHSNWTNKLKNRFKKWVFLSPDTSGSVDNRILNQADYVFFFTDIIKHSTYLRFVRIVREKGIPFGYLHSIHIPMNVREIYGEVVER